MQAIYYVDGCENKDVFQMFMKVLIGCSDSFSLIYFRYKENEKPKRGVSKIKKGLLPYRISSKKVDAWPGTKILENKQGHIYQMETYVADPNQIPIMEQVDTLWDWSYPRFPMDPCFYRDGHVWFLSTTHENINKLYLEENSFPSADDLESIGLKLVLLGYE